MYKYDISEPSEEPIITYLMGYLDSIDFSEYIVFDFHLCRDLSSSEIVESSITDYVLVVRETGENVHYVKRLAKFISKESPDSKIWIYGQVARFRLFKDLPDNVQVVIHDERIFAEKLGVSNGGPSYEEGLVASSYAQYVELNDSFKKRFKAIIETSRGCHFGCKFCFINQGKNYDKRWKVRPIKAVLSDIEHYVSLGVVNFVFYDSEFVGADESNYGRLISLLESIRDRFNINYKIYCRADTLLKFDNFKLLKDSGLVQVFVGAESLYQGDLDAMNKTLNVEDIKQCISKLKDYDIYANISFITFNRNTSIESLSENIMQVKELLKTKSHLTGVPAFTFSFESYWRKTSDVKESKLSKRTYVYHDLNQKEQPFIPEVFNADLEPLMEIYRLLSYEWNKKMVDLNYKKDLLSGSESDAVKKWFAALPHFCIEQMELFLNLFRSGKLTLDSLENHSDLLFSNIRNYYSSYLPEYLCHLNSYSDHAQQLEYASTVQKEEMSEYWLDLIPAN